MEKTNIEKPLILKIEDLKKKTIDSINTCGVPIFIVEYVFKDILQGIHVANEQFIANETNRYMESQMKTETQENDK